MEIAALTASPQPHFQQTPHFGRTGAAAAAARAAAGIVSCDGESGPAPPGSAPQAARRNLSSMFGTDAEASAPLPALPNFADGGSWENTEDRAGASAPGAPPPVISAPSFVTPAATVVPPVVQRELSLKRRGPRSNTENRQPNRGAPPVVRTMARISSSRTLRPSAADEAATHMKAVQLAAQSYVAGQAVQEAFTNDVRSDIAIDENGKFPPEGHSKDLQLQNDRLRREKKQLKNKYEEKIAKLEAQVVGGSVSSPLGEVLEDGSTNQMVQRLLQDQRAKDKEITDLRRHVKQVQHLMPTMMQDLQQHIYSEVQRMIAENPDNRGTSRGPSLSPSPRRTSSGATAMFAAAVAAAANAANTSTSERNETPSSPMSPNRGLAACSQIGSTPRGFNSSARNLHESASAAHTPAKMAVHPIGRPPSPRRSTGSTGSAAAACAQADKSGHHSGLTPVLARDMAASLSPSRTVGGSASARGLGSSRGPTAATYVGDNGSKTRPGGKAASQSPVARTRLYDTIPGRHSHPQRQLNADISPRCSLRSLANVHHLEGTPSHQQAELRRSPPRGPRLAGAAAVPPAAHQPAASQNQAAGPPTPRHQGRYAPAEAAAWQQTVGAVANSAMSPRDTMRNISPTSPRQPVPLGTTISRSPTGGGVHDRQRSRQPATGAVAAGSVTLQPATHSYPILPGTAPPMPPGWCGNPSLPTGGRSTAPATEGPQTQATRGAPVPLVGPHGAPAPTATFSGALSAGAPPGSLTVSPWPTAPPAQYYAPSSSFQPRMVPGAQR